MPPSIYLKKSSGFTLLEVVISIGIIMTLSSVVLSSMSTFRATQTLDAAVEKTLSAFSLSRLDTISSKNDSAYGVRILQDRVTYFKGTVYPGNGNVNNLDFVLPMAIEVANISLNGGGPDVIYQRITGATVNYGTFDIRVKGNTSISTRVTINQTGTVSI